MEHMTTTIEELQQRLDELAVAAHDGERGAREAYAAALAELERRRAEEELEARAERQRAVLEAAEREAQAAAHRRELQARYAELEAQLRALAPEVDEAAGILVDRAQAFLLVAEEQYHLARQLAGQDRPRLRRGDVVANSVLWRLAAVPALAERLPRPDRYFRRPLAELVAQGGAGQARA
jgi:hypothetical protein